MCLVELMVADYRSPPETIYQFPKQPNVYEKDLENILIEVSMKLKLIRKNQNGWTIASKKNLIFAAIQNPITLNR